VILHTSIIFPIPWRLCNGRRTSVTNLSGFCREILSAGRQAPKGRKENSPGRKPGVGSKSSAEPWRGGRKRLRTNAFHPGRGSMNAISYPGAYAPGYYLLAPSGLRREGSNGVLRQQLFTRGSRMIFILQVGFDFGLAEPDGPELMIRKQADLVAAVFG